MTSIASRLPPEKVLTLVDSLVMGCAVLIMMSTQISWQLDLICPVADASDGDHDRATAMPLHERFKLAQAAFSSLNDRTQSLTSIRTIKAFGLRKIVSRRYLPRMPKIPAKKTCGWRVLMLVST